jgi:hypothetical protein
MREVIHRIRKAIIDKLNGSPNVTNLTEFKKRVENTGGILESFGCLYKELTPVQVYDQIQLRGSYIPVYGRVPSDATYPFVRVYSITNNEVDQNQTTFNSEVITRIEVVTRFESDNGGELDCNLIVDECLSLLRTRSANYFDLIEQGFNVYTSQNEGIQYIEQDLSDHTYFRAIIELSNRVEQITPSGGLQNELQIELQS